MDNEFDVLTKGHFGMETLGSGTDAKDWVVLTLDFTRVPSQEQHQHRPMYMSVNAARNLAMGLLALADKATSPAVRGPSTSTH